ncbi:NAD(P)/FAD-dependent oxidoreductase [uncultured Thiothrix sp.]|uniref:NAD(P)/FAD-dependent oxidoreductase n=1 Tax=uncultured Thiothrix sp. TaxID=223185 RepID=UPI0026102B3D|nr:NAD(P)/FAD-dependent oxidoreductase [uncultured Thiothrix sp.]
MKKTAIIIGAGPAGLTAALELLRRTDIQPIILEADNCVGGISRTINYKGNRIDIGGHRFFSKSDWVMNWWKEILPIEKIDEENIELSYQNKKTQTSTFRSNHSLNSTDNVMMVRNRLSRIYFLRKFFDYPLKLTPATLKNLGFLRMLEIGSSYIWSQANQSKPEKSLEDFLINRFGKKLYLTFFKNYTEKVWGVPCHEISAEWGAQRIKGLSIGKAFAHALIKLLPRTSDLSQKNTNTSLIERFLYPKFGPGQMWEEVTKQVLAKGGILHYQHKVVGLSFKDGKIANVEAENILTGEKQTLNADYVISTMPVRDLIKAMGSAPTKEVKQIAQELPYRDFMTVGLLVSKMKANVQAASEHTNNMPPDNWIYIQEQDVKVGRLQIFNNWSPAMVKDPNTIWLGLEYFCNEGDDLWSLPDAELKLLGAKELAKIGMIEEKDVLDSTVIRMPKAYPAYFGSYTQFDKVRSYLDTIPNLFPVGRNGMHRYNNQDHSMLTAKLAVDNIIAGVSCKDNMWAINVDDDYHEEKIISKPNDLTHSSPESITAVA